jgi:ketosteroid isomerase-like protein
MKLGAAGLLVAGVLLLGACAAQTQPTVDTAAAEAEVRDLSMRWIELERNRDAAAIAALFAADGTMYREDQEPLVGNAAIQRHLESEYAENQAMVVGWTIDHVDVAASGDLAIERGTWSVQNAGPARSHSRQRGADATGGRRHPPCASGQ